MCISDSFWEHHLLVFDVTMDLRLLRKTGGCVLCMGVWTRGFCTFVWLSINEIHWRWRRTFFLFFFWCFCGVHLHLLQIPLGQGRHLLHFCYYAMPCHSLSKYSCDYCSNFKINAAFSTKYIIHKKNIKLVIVYYALDLTWTRVVKYVN